MKTREIIVGNEILIEIVSDDLKEPQSQDESPGGTLTVDLVPDFYSPY